MKKKLFLLILPILLTSLMLTGCKKNQEETPDVSSSSLSDEGSPVTPLAPDASLVALNTDKGQILIELFPSLAPNTVKNFLEKANSGFYSGLTFHRRFHENVSMSMETLKELVPVVLLNRPSFPRSLFVWALSVSPEAKTLTFPTTANFSSAPRIAPG